MSAGEPPAAADLDRHPVVLFDGVCNLCAGSVRFIIKRDPTMRFRFASLQSEAARRLLAEVRPGGAPAEGLPDSVVLVDGSGVHVRSDAALRIAAELRSPWRLARRLSIIPRPIRDAMYRLVARSRYRIFGKRESCMVPTPELERRFLPEPEDGAPEPAPSIG